jgi:RND family efflux transporter MFP subunit
MNYQNQPISAKMPEQRGSGIKWFLIIPVILCIAGAFTFYLRAQTGRSLAASTARLDVEQVSVTHPQVGKSDSDISLPATLQGYSESPIYARTSGYIAHWYADIGTHVHEGQLLAEIESPEVDQELSQARSNLSQSKANFVLAEVTAKRYRELISTNSVSQQEVDQNNQNFDAQKANVQAATANVSRLEQLQSFEKVQAPFDGIITQRRTDIGDLINAGNSGTGAELFQIAKINVMRVFVSVPESYSGQISNGLKATLDLISLPGQSFEGAVTRSSHAIAPESHTLLTEIDVPNLSGKLMPGAYAQVHIHLKSPVQPLTVPIGAVLFQAVGPQLAVVNSRNQIELHKITLGRDFGNKIEIASGITQKDQIVSSPPDYLVNGMPVNVEKSASADGN